MSGVKNRMIAFNYFGGKFSYVEELYMYFPPVCDFDHLVDLFMGSLVVSLNYNHGQRIIKTGNDLNHQVVNFFQILRDREEELIELIELTPVATEEYNRSWEESDDPLESARRFYVRVRQSFLGLGCQRKNKGWHMARKHANSNGGESVSRWVNAVPKLRDVANALRRNYQITPWPFETCIEKIDYDRAFFYCDPPYSLRSRVSSNDYLHEFSDEDHERLAEKLHSVEGMAMISGYDCSLMNSLYADWDKYYLTKKRNNIRYSEVQETIWINYEPRPLPAGIKYEQKKLFK